MEQYILNQIKDVSDRAFSAEKEIEGMIASGDPRGIDYAIAEACGFAKATIYVIAVTLNSIYETETECNRLRKEVCNE